MENKIGTWARAAGIRAARTFAQTAVSMLTVGQAVMEVNWINVLSVSAVAAVISMLTSVAGLPEVHGANGQPTIGGGDGWGIAMAGWRNSAWRKSGRLM